MTTPCARDLATLRQQMPRHLREPDARRALGYIALAVLLLAAAGALALWVWRDGAWFWYPVAWFALAFAFTSWFVLGHDCGHGGFLPSPRAMTALGHLFLLPTLYPFHAWRFSHSAHHRHTNHLGARERSVDWDNAWRPLTPRSYRRLWRSAPLSAALYRIGRTVPPIGSALHNLLLHFRPTWYTPAQRPRALFSMAFVLAGLGLGGALVYRATGTLWGLAHFWLIPALLFQLWMALYTFLHHTGEDIPVWSRSEWDNYRGQVLGTLNVYMPRWLSLLHFHIDIHQPHHVLTTIPCYHLPQVQRWLKQSPCAADFRERAFSFGYLWRQLRRCHLWDPEQRRYVSFAEAAAQPARATA